MSDESTTTSSVPAPWPRAYLIIAAALIAMATAAAYVPALPGGFVWDDNAHVPRPDLQSLHGLYRIWFEIGATQQYYPLLYSSFWAQHQLWGDWPIGYHAVNIALHVCVAGLVLVVVRRLLLDRAFRWADEAAVLTAAVFALHPVHAESVAWITEQKNTTSAVFYLLSVLAYLDFDKSRRARPYAVATALFGVSLLCKPVTVTLPPALLVILWWQRGRLSLRRDVLPLVPWLGLSIGSGLLTAYVEHSVVGAQGAEFSLTVPQRLILPGRAVLFYLSKLLWPSELIFVYPRWVVDPSVWQQWVYPLGALLLLIGALIAVRRSRAPLAGYLFFCGSLFPLLGFFNVFLFQYTFVADHFQYLASLGIITLVCGGLVLLASRVRSPAARLALLAPLPIALGVLTFRQCDMYADSELLYKTTIQKNPGCWMAHNNLGVMLGKQDRNTEAVVHLRRVMELNPAYPEASNNLGVVLYGMGRAEEAIASFREALRLKPTYTDALDNLSAALTNAGSTREAVELSARAVELAPERPAYRLNYGIALAAAGKHRESAEQFEEALRRAPTLTEAQWNLAMEYEKIGRRADALTAAERAREQARRRGNAEMAEKIQGWIASTRAKGGAPPQ